MKHRYLLDKTTKKLLKQGIIDISTFINDKEKHRIRKCLIKLIAKGSPEITIYFNGEGGAVDAGLEIYDMLRHYQGKITGVINSYICSMFVIILQGCDCRKALEHSTIMFHMSNESIDLSEIDNKEGYDKEIERLRSLEDQTQDILIRHSKMTKEEIEQITRRKKTISAEEALALGIIDEIII